VSDPTTTTAKGAISIAPSVDADFAAFLAQQSEPWQVADALAARFTADEFPAADGVKSGLHKLLDQYAAHIYKEHGVRLTANTMRNYRQTAIAWPLERREPRASFHAHFAMRGEGRFDEMATRIRQAERENRALSYEMLLRLRSDEKGATSPVSEQERLRKRIAAAVKAVVAEGIIKSSLPDPDWWNGNSITDRQRQLAVAELRHLADLIEGDTQ